MNEIVLTAKPRVESGKAVKVLRNDGFVPGVVYGQGKEPVLVAASARELDKVYSDAGTSRLVDLVIDDKKPINTLFLEVQHDPVKNHLLHFDLYTVKMDEKIRTEIPLHFVGEAEAVHTEGAVLLKTLEAVEIEALPKDLPETIEIDISVLKEIGNSIFVSDLRVGQGVEILTDKEEMVVKLEPPREEEVFEEIAEDAEAQVGSEHGGEEVTEGEEGGASEGDKEAKEENE